LNLLKSF